nr:hypothetical protein [Tanacetum cinerariifolium]
RKKFQVDVSNSSPLVSPSTTINVPRELNSINVAATFGVPLSTVGDLHKLINDIEAGETWAENDYDEFQRFFFFKFDSRAGLEAVLEGGPWLIRKSPIILKKLSMDTRLLNEELTRIPILVKLHDAPI